MEDTSNVGTANERLLKEIRSRMQEAVDYWRPIRDERCIDIRYISGDPWDDQEKRSRQNASPARPCIALDELNQYTNDLINSVRQHPRDVKVDPRGMGADEKTAELREGQIREIGYNSRAQMAHIAALENCVQGSYGYSRISKRYADDGSFDQELLIEPIPNPDCVYLDPHFKQPDGSDARWVFIVEPFRKEDFKKKWPNAEIVDFALEYQQSYPHWIKDDDVIVAEYWVINERKRKLLMLDIASGVKVHADELPSDAVVGSQVILTAPASLEDGTTIPPGAYKILKQRPAVEKSVCQYITNGIEILEENDWEGKYIPVAACMGKELYVDDGGGPERRLLSLIRLAREAQMLYNYTRTCQMELVGMVPKVPAIGYEGQFEGHEDEWNAANRVPLGYLQVKPITDATGTQTLPLPAFNRWEPPIQALEMAAQSARAAIQAAVGVSGLYNGKVSQDQSARSGVALQKLNDQQAQGSFHFIDNYDRYLEHVGRILDDMIPYVYDTEREVPTRNRAGEQKVVRINGPYADPKTKEVQHFQTDKGSHAVTISTGPSYQSEIDEASTFADTLMASPFAPRIADLVVKLKHLGPIGDEMADRLVPPDVAAKAQTGNIPPQVQQMVEAAKQTIQQLTATVNQLQQEKDAKVVEMQFRDKANERDNETKIRIAELNARVEGSIAALEQSVKAMQHSLDLSVPAPAPAGSPDKTNPEPSSGTESQNQE